ncbi:MAG: ATP-binding protein [Ruminococcaceae bacterium]|nr:ATP-binding protein [Oscillospiraceae bacterium]
MSYLSKYYTMAENELDIRRNKNAEIQKEHIEKAEKKVPQIKELRKQIGKQGVRLSTVLLEKGSAKEAVKEISVKTIEIKRKIRDLLVENGFDENYLEPVYSCEKCKDSGLYEGKRCSCFMNDVRSFQCADLNRSSGMNLCSFDTFDLSLYPEKNRQTMERVYSYCVKFAEDFHLPCKGILMTGATGLGKTHLSLAIGNKVINSGYGVIYGSAPDLLRRVEKEHFNNKEEETDTEQLLHDCDLLILDDLGAEFDSKFNQSILYNLINMRINKGIPTIISTNATLSELKERYGERILSRMLTMENLPFCGNDIRILKNMSGK